MTAVVLFTRDLRVHDNPVLHTAAAAGGSVVPLFVLDDGILRGDYNRPNRAHFLAAALRDLDGSLRERGAGLVVRRGDVVTETAKLAAAVGADVVHVAGDVSRYATRRAERLAAALAEHGVELDVHDDALFVVPPGRVTPSGKDHMAVFTPYYRRWRQQPRRAPHGAPRTLRMPRVPGGRGTVPAARDICAGDTSPELPDGGETAGRARLAAFLRDDAAGYTGGHDDLAGDVTSRLSPYLHFGCLSPLEVVTRADAASDFVRQVAWRDFHAQVLAAHPDAVRQDYRSRGDRWRRSARDLAAWQAGRTGLPLVDAGMRQLRQEGWMHNRARLVVGHFLVKTLYLDWRLGARHFADLLVDGDTANNTMNWQWVAGTGTDSRFNRTYDVTAQARRHDPRGDYVRRYVPELAPVDGAAVHEPWKLPAGVRGDLDYPAPIVDVREGNERFLRARGKR
jgi:deoxyribodipyrimidine photo-lyase